MTLIFAVNYSGKEDILHAVETLISRHQTLNAENVDRYLEVPTADLMIRTGGEQRLSNGMIWQCSYAELYFTTTL